MKYFFSLQPILQHTCTLLAAGFLFAVSAQPVNLTGTVKDSLTLKGIAGAALNLKIAVISASTDSMGRYAFGLGVRPHEVGGGAFAKAPAVKQGYVYFGIVGNVQFVRIDVCDLLGRTIAPAVERMLDRGSYRFNPLRKRTSAGHLCFVKLRIGGTDFVFKVLDVNVDRGFGLSRISGDGPPGTLSKIAAPAIDTLIVSAAGYATVRRAISSYTAVNDFLLAQYGPHIGTISFENGSYQSCIAPLVITVVDSDLSSATVPVYVKSTTDPVGITVVLKKTAGAAGTYSDSVFFSIVKSDSARRLIKVGDGDTVTAFYGDVLPPALVYASTVWNGLPGNVQPKGSPISGIIHGLGITLWDSDITDSAVTIAVWSKKDTVGLRVSLARVAQSSGDYIGKIGLSLRRSRGDSVLAVGPGSDTIFMRYHDLTPKADIMGTGCIWQPMPAIMFLDSAQYHGTASVMTINLTDDDIEDSAAVVFVTSTKDPTGIKDTLRVTGTTIRNFIGTVGFTTGASRPGFISAADGDSVKVIYMDDSPVQPVMQSAVWSSK